MKMWFAAPGAISRRLFPIAAAAALVAAAFTPAGADDAAQALLAKHKAYAGWSFGDGTFKTLVTEWTISQTKDGSALGHKTMREMGATERTDYTSEKNGDSQFGFTGAFLWQSSENGFTTRLLGDPAKAIVARSLIFDEAAALGTATVRPSQTIDGKSYAVIRAKLDASLPVDLYIDPETGAYRRAILDPGGAFEATYNILETSAPIAGKRIVSRYTAGGSTYVLDKATPNKPIAAADLAPPPPIAKWTFGAGDAIPIKVTKERIYITAKMNGVEGHFILDTGAADIFVSNDFAKRARLEVRGSSAAVGIGGSIKTGVRQAKTISIGDNTLSDVVVTSGYTNDDEPDGKDGLVGYDLFGGALVVLNLDDSNITLLDPTKLQPDTSAGVPVLVDLSDQIPVVQMKLNGQVDVLAILDSGNPLWVTFDRALVSKNGLKFLIDRGKLASEIPLGGIGGYVDVECGKLQSLSLGQITYNGPPACMGQATLGSTNDRNVLVGFDFLKHFNIVFDYPAGMMLFQQRKTEPK